MKPAGVLRRGPEMSPEVSPENLAGGWHGVLRRGPAHQAVNLAGHRLFRLFWAQYDSIHTGAFRVEIRKK